MSEYREHLRDEAETFLYSPALQKLLAASEAEGRISQEEMAELANVQGNPDEYPSLVASLVHKVMNWRHDPKMERHQLKDDDLSDEYREAIRQAAGELMMTDEVPIPHENYEIAAVLGATVAPVANRTNYLYDALERGDCRAKFLVGLGAERPMMPPDLRNAGPYAYVELSEVETDLLTYASRRWLVEHGYDIPTIDKGSLSNSWLNDRNYGSQYRYQTVSYEDDQHRPDWAPDTIVNLSAPYNHAHHPRANTGETIDFMIKLAELKEGDKALFVSHQPYLLGQKFEIERICLEHGVQVDVAGYESNNAKVTATVLGGEIAKAAQKAQQLREALTQGSVGLAA